MAQSLERKKQTIRKNKAAISAGEKEISSNKTTVKMPRKHMLLFRREMRKVTG